MVEGQGPVTPGNRRKRIGANSPACFAEDEITLEDPCYAEVIFLFKYKCTLIDNKCCSPSELSGVKRSG